MKLKLPMLLLLTGFALPSIGCAPAARGQRDRNAAAATQPSVNSEGREIWSTRRQQDWKQWPLRLEQKPTVVTQGPSPLVYIFDLGGPLRVVDLTNRVAIATAVAPPQSLVRVDDVHGVTIGRETIVPGPLPAGHRYGIYLDPETDNTFRQSTDSAQSKLPN